MREEVIVLMMCSKSQTKSTIYILVVAAQVLHAVEVESYETCRSADRCSSSCRTCPSVESIVNKTLHFRALQNSRESLAATKYGSLCRRKFSYKELWSTKKCECSSSSCTFPCALTSDCHRCRTHTISFNDYFVV